MIDSKEIEPFLDEYVAVGVPHDIIPNKLFFYFGKLKYVDSEEVQMELKNGFKIIPIENIRDIHKARGGQR